MAGAEKDGAHKPSFPQDLEAGRPMELEAVVGAVIELGDRLGVPMPATRAVYSCAKLLDEQTRRHLADRIGDGTSGPSVVAAAIPGPTNGRPARV